MTAFLLSSYSTRKSGTYRRWCFWPSIQGIVMPCRFIHLTTCGSRSRRSIIRRSRSLWNFSKFQGLFFGFSYRPCLLIAIFNNPRNQSWDGTNLYFNLPEHFPCKIQFLAFRKRESAVWIRKKLRADVVEQRAINAVLEHGCATGIDSQRFGHFEQFRLNGFPN